jgi:hypothetical protein
MIEVRTYQEDGADAAELIQRVWKELYAGKSWVYYWDQPSLEWQVLSPRPGPSELRLGAYRGAELVGCLFADPFTLRLGDREVPGSMSSWLTVDTRAAPQGAVALVKQMYRRFREYERPISLAYMLGDRTAPAFKFWSAYAEAFPRQFGTLRKVGYWARVLDSRAIAELGVGRLERIGGRLLRFWPRVRPPEPRQATAEATIRNYRSEDLMACLTLVNAAQLQTDLALVWEPTRLAIQLWYKDTARTLVVEQVGKVIGFLNYHRTTLLGRGPLRAALIDLFCGASLTQRQRVALLRTGAHRMAQEDVQVVVMLRSAMCPTAALAACGFVPLPAHEHLVCMHAEPGDRPARPKSFSLLLR